MTCGILAKIHNMGSCLLFEMRMLPKTLAEALHMLLQLGYADLSNNTLEGSLPEAWGNLTNVSLVIAVYC